MTAPAKAVSEADLDRMIGYFHAGGGETVRAALVELRSHRALSAQHKAAEAVCAHLSYTDMGDGISSVAIAPTTEAIKAMLAYCQLRASYAAARDANRQAGAEASRETAGACGVTPDASAPSPADAGPSADSVDVRAHRIVGGWKIGDRWDKLLDLCLIELRAASSAAHQRGVQEGRAAGALALDVQHRAWTDECLRATESEAAFRAAESERERLRAEVDTMRARFQAACDEAERVQAGLNQARADLARLAGEREDAREALVVASKYLGRRWGHQSEAATASTVDAALRALGGAHEREQDTERARERLLVAVTRAMDPANATRLVDALDAYLASRAARQGEGAK